MRSLGLVGAGGSVMAADAIRRTADAGRVAAHCVRAGCTPGGVRERRGAPSRTARGRAPSGGGLCLAVARTSPTPVCAAFCGPFFPTQCELPG